MILKQMGCALALALGGAAVLAAQDSIEAPDEAAAEAPAAERAAAPGAVLVEAVIAQSVVDRVPQDTGSAFPAEVGQVVCWTKVTDAAPGSVIHHVWFHGDTQVGDVELTVGGSPWRTWSRKTVPAEATGGWHVEIRDAGGALLRRVDFVVGG